MTTVADGLMQWGGVPVGVNPLFNKVFYNNVASYKKGRAWFVDPSTGRSGSGVSPAQAFSTMEEAFDNLHSGDIIYAIGNIREQLVTPAQVFDVTVIGCGNRPRNADSTPEGGQYAAVTWRAPASGGTAAQATVRVLQQGWTFYNILFNMIDTNAAGIELVRNAASGDSERDASHASIIGCRFAGAGVGVRCGVAGTFTEIPNNVLIQGNTFQSNTTAIGGAIQGIYWQILDNAFVGNTNDIVVPLRSSKILRNSMSLAPTGCIVLTGGADNMVSYNALPGTYADGALYAPASGDNWNGNAASTGFTDAVPA